MKTVTLLGLLALFIASLAAQSPATDDPARVEGLIQQVQAQQVQLAENQARIDEKLATLAETIRVAKIYSSRGGR